MTQKILEEEIFVAVTPEVARAFMADLQHHDKIHPLIIDVQRTNTITHPDGTHEDHFKIRDQLRQGPLTYKITYRVTLSINPSGEIVSDAYQFPGVHLHNITSFRADNKGTWIKEHIEINSSRLLIATVYKKAQESHHEMLKNLKRVLETSQSNLS